MTHTNMDNIKKALAEASIDFVCDLDSSEHSSFKIGGTVDLALFPKSTDEMIQAISLFDECGVKFEILGNASNVLFAFDRYRGAFIFTDKLAKCSVEGNRIFCEAGASLTHIANVAASNSFAGFEFAYGIPATVGGAVYMNAGAFGGQISDLVEYTLAYDRKQKTVAKIYENAFGYRNSMYMQRPELVCLGASFVFSAGDPSEIRAKMAQNMRLRREKQPLEYASAGSYFKRPEGNFAGKLIEDCSLKGERVGSAEVSQKHAGFIINLGGATYGDVLALEKKITERVSERFGVTLEREVRLITD